MHQDQQNNAGADKSWKQKKGFTSLCFLLAVFGSCCLYAVVVSYSDYRRFTTTTDSPMTGNLIRFGDSLGISDSNEKIFLSLWLIPGPDQSYDDDFCGGDDCIDDGNTVHNHNIYEGTQEVIDELAEKYNGPTFIPHVTIVGGIQVDSEDGVHDIVNKLQKGFASHYNRNTVIDGTFKGILEELSTWSQAVAIEMIPSNSFLELCKVSKSLLHIDDGDCSTFSPPNKVPHMSLYYGLPPNVPDASSIDLSWIFGEDTPEDKSFQSSIVQLWKTTPSTLEGVPDWELVHDFDFKYTL